MKEQIKSTKKSSKQIRKFQTKLVTTTEVTVRDNDFINYNSTYISAQNKNKIMLYYEGVTSCYIIKMC